MKSTIKTIVIVVLAMLVVFTTTFTILTFSLIGCGNMTELRELIARDIMFEELSNITIENEVEVVVPEIEVTLPQIDGTQPEVTTPETDNTTDMTVPQPEEDEVEPLVIWNMNGIKITCLYLDDEALFGTVIKFEIENNTDANIRVRIDSVTVDGYTLSLYGWNCAITANRKAVEELTLLSSELEDCAITDISTVELDFVVVDTNTYTTIQELPTIRVTFE